MYTISQLAELSRVSSRTLRYYDDISLLKPALINKSGYRIYTQREVDILHRILVYRSMDVPLKEIKRLLESDQDDIVVFLTQHYTELLKQRQTLNIKLAIAENVIKSYKEGTIMNNKDKFDMLKQQIIKENMSVYGAEAVAKYGMSQLSNSYQKMASMTVSDYNNMQDTERNMIDKLQHYMQADKLDINLGQEIYNLHKNWLLFNLDNVTPEVHMSIANSYIEDDRFRQYYDNKAGKGATTVLQRIIVQYAKKVQ